MSVKILASKKGNAFEQTAKYATNGGLMVMAVEEVMEQPTGFSVIKDGFVARQQRRIAFVTATQAQFDAIFKAEGITPAGGVELPGVIQVTEQLTPFNVINPDNDIKYPNAAAKAVGLMCRVGNNPIYRRTTWIPDGAEDTQDVLVPHDNTAQIQEFVKSMNAGNKPNSSALQNASPAVTTTGNRRGNR